MDKHREIEHAHLREKKKPKKKNYARHDARHKEKK
jgi:hypothetical protein